MLAIRHARNLIDAGESLRQVAKTFDVSIAKLYRFIPAVASHRDTRDLFTRT